MFVITGVLFLDVHDVHVTCMCRLGSQSVKTPVRSVISMRRGVRYRQWLLQKVNHSVGRTGLTRELRIPRVLSVVCDYDICK